MTEIASPILELRKSRGLNQNRFALLLGCSKGHLSDVEHGFAPLRPGIIEILNELGLDGEELAKEQEAYIDYRKEETKAMFAGISESKG